MGIQAFGYFGVGTDRLDDWTDFATGQLGLQRVDGGGTSRAFRMDDRRQRLMVNSGSDAPAQRYFGWETADAAALDALAARLEAAGVAVRREPQALADRRLVAEAISFADPDGNRLEAFHGPMLADTPFRPGRDILGFRAGTLGMGHAVLTASDFDASLAFYRDLLGFRISDFCHAPRAVFLHVNPRHHSLALFAHPRMRMHHLMMELYSLDDVGQGYDIARAVDDRVAVTLGRHPNDYMTSFYMRSPSDFLVEYGWGAREVDVANWQPAELQTVASFWGHEGLMQSVSDGASPHQPSAHHAPPRSAGRRAPVQVLEGSYQKLSGVCPWWDLVTSH
jgi:2,3-dihydroxybiphenyl 1,2-dioxygenase